MTIFDFINSLLFTKKKEVFSTIDDEEQFIPYMVNRWVSMYSDKMVQDCNMISRYLQTFSDKKEIYKLMNIVYTKVPNKHIRYIKRSKEEKKEIENIDIMVKKYEISKREIKDYLAILNP